MSKSVVAKRYAQALFQLAQKNEQTSSVQEELLEVKKVFENNKEIEQLLVNPSLTSTKKKELLSVLFKDANPLIQNTLFVLLDEKRINETVNVIDEFNSLAYDSVGVAEAKVYSTQLLSDDEKSAISSAFAAKVGKLSLRIENVIDPSLIGGIRLQIGNRIYDSSLSGKLERLKKDLIGS
ncbi:F0F1 ATP synthase subunit delta [Sporosarcina sp. CAU 1771]